MLEGFILIFLEYWSFWY